MLLAKLWGRMLRANSHVLYVCRVGFIGYIQFSLGGKKFIYGVFVGFMCLA